MALRAGPSTVRTNARRVPGQIVAVEGMDMNAAAAATVAVAGFVTSVLYKGGREDERAPAAASVAGAAPVSSPASAARVRKVMAAAEAAAAEASAQRSATALETTAVAEAAVAEAATAEVAAEEAKAQIARARAAVEEQMTAKAAAEFSARLSAKAIPKATEKKRPHRKHAVDDSLPCFHCIVCFDGPHGHRFPHIPPDSFSS